MYKIYKIYEQDYDEIILGLCQKSGEKCTVSVCNFSWASEDNKSNSISSVSVGDNVDGEIYVTCVVNHYVTSDILSANQPFEESSFVRMVGQIEEVIDEFTLLIRSIPVFGELKVEFENRVNYKKGAIIFFDGELWLDDAIINFKEN